MATNVPYFDPFTFPKLKEFGKSAIGFEEVLKRLVEVGEALPKIPSYPPYNIRKIDENKYAIEIAVAGFGKQDIEIEMKEGTLAVKGHIETNDPTNLIFQGIADRAFTRRFALADNIEVKGADLVNGMLKIWLERFVPEEKKAKKININSKD